MGLIHKGVRRIVTITATPEVTEHLYSAYRLAVLGVALLYVFLGAALVLLRPSLTTWGFFLYCLGNTPFTFFTAVMLFPFPWPFVADFIFYELIDAAGFVGLLVFALCFLSEPMPRWRLAAVRLMPWLFATLLILYSFVLYQRAWVGGPPGELLFRIAFVLIAALWSLVVLYLFLNTYVRARGADRQRIRWIVVGFALNLAVQYVAQLLPFYVPSTPVWVIQLLYLSSIIVPLTVAYAVIKHRVIDVSFVVSRALVYGILTSLLVGAFALIE